MRVVNLCIASTGSRVECFYDHQVSNLIDCLVIHTLVIHTSLPGCFTQVIETEKALSHKGAHGIRPAGECVRGHD